MTAATRETYDLILVGGGLANCLLALRLRQLQPQINCLILESGATIGGLHTWSCFASDVAAGALDWLEPLIERRWSGYQVKFHGYERMVATDYLSITSERLNAVMHDTLREAIRTGTMVEAITADSVMLMGGKRLTARLVIDGRGFAPSPYLQLSWQKFLGQQVETAQPHGLTRPIIMDATVAQHDGYRFVYVLPFTDRRLLIEDTYYSADRTLDPLTLRDRIQAYARTQGWQIEKTLSEEQGILPLCLDGDFDSFWQEPARSLPCLGMRAGLFHPVTGYSLPAAVELADQLARDLPATPKALRQVIFDHAQKRWQRQGFFRWLNRMLFLPGLERDRWRVLAQFYRRGPALIERFYADRLRFTDKLRLLTGRPPVSVWRALTSLRSSFKR